MIRIPRWIGCLDEGQELNLFSDASEKAVGCCIYVTSRSSQKLLFAKSSVAPLKVLTFSRLDLQAACLGCRSLKFVCEEMRIDPKTFLLGLLARRFGIGITSLLTLGLHG